MADMGEYLRRLALIAGTGARWGCARCGRPANAPLRDGTWLCPGHLEEAGFGVVTVKPYAETLGFTTEDEAVAASLGISLHG